MMTLRKALIGAVMGVVVGACLVVPVTAQNAPAAAKATAIRTVDLLKAFQGMQQRTDSDNEINTMRTNLIAEGDKLKAKLDEATKELSLFTAETPEMRMQQEKVLRAAGALAAHNEFIERRLAMEGRLKTLSIYNNLKKAIELYAKENGIGLVLMAEEPNLPESQSAQELNMKISLKKVLYVEETLDITKQIIDRANTEWLKTGNRPKAP
jgi:Skp family chaperone for outer membrane proteins